VSAPSKISLKLHRSTTEILPTARGKRAGKQARKLTITGRKISKGRRAKQAGRVAEKEIRIVPEPPKFGYNSCHY